MAKEKIAETRPPTDKDIVLLDAIQDLKKTLGVISENQNKTTRNELGLTSMESKTCSICGGKGHLQADCFLLA